MFLFIFLKLKGTAGENVLYKPGTTTYTQLSNAFSKEAIGIDIFFFAQNYMDLGELCKKKKFKKKIKKNQK